MAARSSAASRLAIITIPYGNSQEDMQKLSSQLKQEKKPGDYIVVVDNHPDGRGADFANKHTQIFDKVLRANNPGFGAACNLAAATVPKDIDLLFFLNPDAIPEPGCFDELRKTTVKTNWAGWMPLLLTGKGKINSAGNALHMSGLSWTRNFGEDPGTQQQEQVVPLLSGACLVIRRVVFEELGGFYQPYFMYFEDTDICLRARLHGYELGLIPSAKVVHDYEFKKGDYKYFCLERNRILMILRLYPFWLLIAMLPLFVVVELGLTVVSLVEHRALNRIKAIISVVGMLPQILSSRKSARQGNRLTTRQFIQLLQPELSSPLLGRLENFKPVELIFSLYYKGLLTLFR